MQGGPVQAESGKAATTEEESQRDRATSPQVLPGLSQNQQWIETRLLPDIIIALNLVGRGEVYPSLHEVVQLFLYAE